MDAFTAVVFVVGFALFYRLIFFALHRKGDLRAGAKIGPSSFFLEVRDKDKKGSSRELPTKSKRGVRPHRPAPSLTK
jgi:hypothetical protein